MPAPPRIELLTRVRADSDGASRTLFFTFPARRRQKAAMDFILPEFVPEFEGEQAWFELERMKGGGGAGGEAGGGVRWDRMHTPKQTVLREACPAGEAAFLTIADLGVLLGSRHSAHSPRGTPHLPC